MTLLLCAGVLVGDYCFNGHYMEVFLEGVLMKTPSFVIHFSIQPYLKTEELLSWSQIHWYTGVW